MLSILTAVVALLVWISQAKQSSDRVRDRRQALLVLEAFLEQIGLLPILVSLLVGILVFVGFWSTAQASAKTDNHNDTKKTRWEILQQLRDLLHVTGCDKDIYKGIFHANFATNCILLGRIQKQLYSVQNWGTHVCRTPHMWDETSRMLRYSSAVYGHYMVTMTQTELAVSQKETSVLETFCTPYKSHSQVICDLAGVDPSDILVLHTGGSIDYCSHSIVVDHRHKQIVFAIRGSFCMNDIFRVAQFTQTPFYGGVAHSGYATMAKSTWEKATEHGANLFSHIDPEYELVLTGHSLGASVAILMTIMIHKEQLMGDRHVRCVAFGPMPPFSQVCQVSEVLPHITAFACGDDLIPTESLHGWRVLNESLAAINRERSRLSYCDVFRLLVGYKEPSKELVHEMAHVVPQLKSIPGAPLFTIPASNIFQLDQTNGRTAAWRLDAPQWPMRRPILASTSLLSDHAPAQYQRAINELIGTTEESVLVDE